MSTLVAGTEAHTTPVAKQLAQKLGTGSIILVSVSGSTCTRFFRTSRRTVEDDTFAGLNIQPSVSQSNEVDIKVPNYALGAISTEM